MSSNVVSPETETVLANQKTILQNQALILKDQECIKKSLELLSVIINNQHEILAEQRHCMYRDAVEEYLKPGRDPLSH